MGDVWSHSFSITENQLDREIELKWEDGGDEGLGANEQYNGQHELNESK